MPRSWPILCTTRTAPAPEVLIGNGVVIGYGAQVLGPSIIGSYSSPAVLTGIGPGAVINHANVAAGAYVGALAQVGGGITIPAGKLVLPGQVVTTEADLTNTNKVVTIAGNALATSLVNELNLLRTTNLTLALGYIALYQGQAATGASPGVSATQTSIFSGNLAAVEGAGAQPGTGTPTATTAPDGGPTFPTPHDGPAQGLLFGFRARVTGQVNFLTRANKTAHSLGQRNSIRADQGQTPIAARPITIGSIAQTGTGVTISNPSGAAVYDRPELPGRFGRGHHRFRQGFRQRRHNRCRRGRGRELPPQWVDRGRGCLCP